MDHHHPPHRCHLPLCHSPVLHHIPLLCYCKIWRETTEWGFNLAASQLTLSLHRHSCGDMYCTANPWRHCQVAFYLLLHRWLVHLILGAPLWTLHADWSAIPEEAEERLGHPSEWKQTDAWHPSERKQATMDLRSVLENEGGFIFGRGSGLRRLREARRTRAF